MHNHARTHAHTLARTHTHTHTHIHKKSIAIHCVFLFFTLIEVCFYAAMFVRGVDKGFSQCTQFVRPYRPYHVVHIILTISYSLLVYCFPGVRFLHIVCHSDVLRMYLLFRPPHHQLIIFTVIIMSLSFLSNVQVFASQIVLRNRCLSPPAFLPATVAIPMTFIMSLFQHCRGFSATIPSSVKHIIYACKYCKCNLCSRRRRFHILEIHKRQERFAAGRTCARASS